MKSKLTFPPIGLRIIKSAMGVFLCFLIDLLRGGQGIVFYSQLAVLWCMQDYISETKKKALQRIIGTVIGALYGLLLLLLLKNQLPQLLSPVLVSVFIVIVLYTTVVIKKKQASYFSCVVFLSIVINHGGDVNPYLFVWNRFLDTMIGIGIGVVVNGFQLPRRKRRDVLFVSGVDETLLDAGNNLTPFERVELNRMIEDGALFTVSTMETPATLWELLGGISLRLPVIAMDGAALFDFANKRYEKVYVLSSDKSRDLVSLFEKRSLCYFANVILDDLLIIYYQEGGNERYTDIVERLRKSPYRNYVCRPLPEENPVVYFMVIEKDEVIASLRKELMEAGDGKNLIRVQTYPDKAHPGYSFLKIYNHNATRENMLSYLRRQIPCREVVTFGTIEGRYNHVIAPGDSNQVVKLMKKDFEPLIWKK